ncbi:MAG: hypothetical protein JWO83_1027 [Caulobacteraceae bacterium]|nr:hypothetical protein [Caulobacteraceae bacterium]
MKPAKLKVFQARFGFHDSVVAAPSQAAALRAWGTHQNLFADGQASVAIDPRAVAAALADPGTPLLRPVGTDGAFERAPGALPKVSGVRARAVRPPPKAKAAPSPKPPPDRSALDAAEAAMRTLDDRRDREEAEFRRRQVELSDARAAARAAYEESRKAATAALAAARREFREAGGKL